VSPNPEAHYASSGRPVRAGVVVALVAVSLGLMSCSSEGSRGLASTPDAPSSSASALVECTPAGSRSEVPEVNLLTAELKLMNLPSGTCFVDVGAYQDDQPGMIGVYVNLKVPASSGPDDLRSVATDIAHKVKTMEVAEKITSLRVTNWRDYDDSGGARYDAFLKDDNFQAHAWDGSLSREVEMALWEVQDRE
jgi:hypothetical protein